MFFSSVRDLLFKHVCTSCAHVKPTLIEVYICLYIYSGIRVHIELQGLVYLHVLCVEHVRFMQSLLYGRTHAAAACLSRHEANGPLTDTMWPFEAARPKGIRHESVQVDNY